MDNMIEIRKMAFSGTNYTADASTIPIGKT